MENLKGLILVNAYWREEVALYQPKRLKKEFEKLNVEVDLLSNNTGDILIEDSQIVSKLRGYDFCVYLDKDKYVSNALEKLGLRLYNRHESIRICDDKMETYLALINKKIPMCKTIPGQLCFVDDARIMNEDVLRIEKELNYPIIIKQAYGSMGRGVYLVETRDELISISNQILRSPHVYQEFISTSRGKDLRVVVVGKKAIGGMIRSSDNDFRSNISTGGSGTAITLDKYTKDLAQLIADELNLDYAGIDFLFKEDGTLCLCEVNSNAFFYGFEKATKINVAKTYAEYIIEDIKINRRKK